MFPASSEITCLIYSKYNLSSSVLRRMSCWTVQRIWKPCPPHTLQLGRAVTFRKRQFDVNTHFAYSNQPNFQRWEGLNFSLTQMVLCECDQLNAIPWTSSSSDCLKMGVVISVDVWSSNKHFRLWRGGTARHPNQFFTSINRHLLTFIPDCCSAAIGG